MVMEIAGDELFARSGLSQDKDRGRIWPRHAGQVCVQLFQESARGVAGADDLRSGTGVGMRGMGRDLAPRENAAERESVAQCRCVCPDAGNVTLPKGHAAVPPEVKDGSGD